MKMPGSDEPFGVDEVDEVTTFEDVEEEDESAPAGLTLEPEEEADIARQVEEFRTNNAGKDPDPLEVN